MAVTELANPGFGAAYAILVFCGAVFTIAAGIVWVADHWVEWADRRRRGRADRDAIRFCSRPAAHFGPCERGTVGNRADPSPRPELGAAINEARARRQPKMYRDTAPWTGEHHNPRKAAI